MTMNLKNQSMVSITKINFLLKSLLQSIKNKNEVLSKDSIKIRDLNL